MKVVGRSLKQCWVVVRSSTLSTAGQIALQRIFPVFPEAAFEFKRLPFKAAKTSHRCFIADQNYMPGENSGLFHTFGTTIIEGTLLSKGHIRLYHAVNLVFLPPILGLDTTHRFWTHFVLCAHD
jgi:hypothetical protein